MRTSSVLALGLIAAGLAAVPSTGHAAGYSQFSGKGCGYTIDAPAGWRVSRSATSDSFLERQSATKYSAVVVLCTSGASNVTARGLTSAEYASYQKTGWTLSKVKYSNGLGIFTGHKALTAGSAKYTAVIEVTAGTQHKKGWAFLYSADATSFQKNLSIYIHMLSSFKSR